MEALAYVREAPEPEDPPPSLSRSALVWARANLFSSLGSSLTTIVFVALGAYLIPQLVAWATTRAVWTAADGAACRLHQDGACWAFVAAKWDYLRFGSYPVAERWRVDIVEAIGAVLIVWLLWTKAPRRAWGALLFFVVYPIMTLILLHGSSPLGLPVVDTLLWGGIFVTPADGGRRDRLLAASRRASRSRAAFGPACRQVGQRPAHRVRARRAFHHDPVHGQYDVAVVRARNVDARSLAAPTRGHSDLLGGLYGGRGARRPSGIGAKGSMKARRRSG